LVFFGSGMTGPSKRHASGVTDPGYRGSDATALITSEEQPFVMKTDGGGALMRLAHCCIFFS
jgi:hypothetical protein